MKQIYFVTRNYEKFNCVSNLLSRYDIKVVQVPQELPRPRTDDLQDIVREKILFAYAKIRKPCIVSDSGFYVNSLNGFPMTFVNFALKTIGIEGILKLIEGKRRECEFRNCLAYLDDKLSEPVYFESNTEGILSKNPKGVVKGDSNNEVLSLVFMPKGSKKTLAQMTFEEYQEWRAEMYENSFVTKFGEWICKAY